MNIIISAPHFEITEALKAHIHNEAEKLNKFSHLIDSDLKFTLDISHKEHYVECSTHVKKHTVIAKEHSDDMYKSINKSVKELSRQIRQQKEIQKKHHHKKEMVA